MAGAGREPLPCMRSIDVFPRHGWHRLSLARPDHPRCALVHVNLIDWRWYQPFVALCRRTLRGLRSLVLLVFVDRCRHRLPIRRCSGLLWSRNGGNTRRVMQFEMPRASDRADRQHGAADNAEEPRLHHFALSACRIRHHVLHVVSPIDVALTEAPWSWTSWAFASCASADFSSCHPVGVRSRSVTWWRGSLSHALGLSPVSSHCPVRVCGYLSTMSDRHLQPHERRHDWLDGPPEWAYARSACSYGRKDDHGE